MAYTSQEAYFFCQISDFSGWTGGEAVTVDTNERRIRRLSSGRLATNRLNWEYLVVYINSLDSDRAFLCAEAGGSSGTESAAAQLVYRTGARLCASGDFFKLGNRQFLGQQHWLWHWVSTPALRLPILLD